MISVFDLRQKLIDAADELNLPLTLRQVDALTTLVVARASRGVAPLMTISSQRHAVLVGLAAGESVEETAARLARSLETVKSHRKHLYEQLGARNAAHAVAIADRMGLLRMSQTETRP
ncbi:response regulator transcription factor [Streptomyces sp. NPDC001156]